MKTQEQEPVESPRDAVGHHHTTKDLADWIGVYQDIPIGVFALDRLAGVVHINPGMRDHLKLDNMPISPILEEYFWSRLESLGDDPVRTRNLIREVNQRIVDGKSGDFSFSIAGNRCLSIQLTQLDPNKYGTQSYTGVTLERVDERALISGQIEMMDEMSVLARKAGAAAAGNLDALVGNLRIWNPDILEDFLSGAIEQQNLVNQSLDMILNLIRTFESIPTFTDTVNLVDLFSEIISETEGIEIRVLDGQPQDALNTLSVIDPALTRLALKYMLQEIMFHNPEEKIVDVSYFAGDYDFGLRLEYPTTLPLPGLSAEQDVYDQSPQAIKMYLAQQIIAAQGGSLEISGKSADSSSISSIEIHLPTTQLPGPYQKSEMGKIRQMAVPGRILLAETQTDYQIILREALEDVGYRVDLALDGSTALDMAQTITPDLIIVARNLPGLDGLLVTQGIRRWSSIPIIMISERTNPDDLIYAYQIGVDDYLRKPFQVPELVARAEVCLRRSENSNFPVTPDIFQSNLIRIDYSTRQVWVRGREVNLTPIEYNLLVFMSRQGKKIMAYEQLLESVWEGPEKGSRQGLFVHVKRLREKIETEPKNPQIITNKWGVGYEFNP